MDRRRGLPDRHSLEVAEAVEAQLDQLWGTEAMVAMLAPSRAGDERFRRWFAKLQRAGASPRAAQVLRRAVLEVDVWSAGCGLNCQSRPRMLW